MRKEMSAAGRGELLRAIAELLDGGSSIVGTGASMLPTLRTPG